MLLIPFDRPPDWRRPPAATALFALLCLAVFVLLQSDDHVAEAEAMEQYQERGLKERELAAYQGVLEERGAPDHPLRGADADQVPPDAVFWTLLGDAPFMERLTSGALELGRDTDWQRDRAAVEATLEGSTLWAWSLRPAAFEPATLVSHIFLHADPMHLIGNLFFLVAVGFLVEGAIRARLMAPAFLAAGILAGAADLVITPDRHIPGVGASGAIAGLMGLYSVVFWTQRVQFFYFIGVYASVTRAPALVLLPLWLGYELFAWFQAGEGNTINYAAHAVGLTVGGTVGAGLQSLWPGAIDRGWVGEKARQEADSDRREQIDACMRALDYGRARTLLREALEAHPHDRTLLRQLQLCLRPTPESRAYHDHTRAILGLAATDSETDALVLEVWRDYRQRAQPAPWLGDALMADLARRLIRMGHPAEAEPLVRRLEQRGTQDPAALALALARAYQRLGDQRRARSWLETIRDRYAETPEAHRALELLRG